MTTTPEHDKLSALQAASPVAAEIARLLLDSGTWHLVKADSDVNIDATSLVAEILGIDVDAYQDERLRALNVSTVVSQLLVPAAVPVEEPKVEGNDEEPEDDWPLIGLSDENTESAVARLAADPEPVIAAEPRWSPPVPVAPSFADEPADLSGSTPFAPPVVETGAYSLFDNAD